MPDSLTKFKEAPTKKADDVTSSGGSSDDDDSTPTCTTGTDPACTSPGTFTYPGTKDYKFLLNEDGELFELPEISPSYSNYIEGHHEYISIEIPTTFASDTGMTINIDDESQFEGNPNRFLPKTFYDISATYSTPEFPSDEVQTETFAVTIAQDIEILTYPSKVGDQLILVVDDVTPFSTVSGYNSISAANGITAQISYIDVQNKELHVTVTENSGGGFFSIDGDVDNSAVFFNKKATSEAVYNTYPRTTAIQTSLEPVVTGYAAITTKEHDSMSYSIFPSLPPGLSFDQMRGTIGTLKAYQNVDDGTIAVVEGSRDIVGTGTAFLSHLQINSVVDINGELHKIESIESNSLARSYRPFATTTSVTTFKKILKGSVSLVNGSPVVTGTETAFSSEVIPSKNLVIDAVADFTGIDASIGSVVDNDTITLSANFAGTALTIPELKATSYVISAKNILGRTITRLLTLSLLNPVQPKTLAVVAYNLSINDKVVLYLEDVSSFTRGGYLSNRAGTIAQIDYIDETNNKIFATVRQIGNYCTVATETNSTACSNANGYWLPKNFNDEDQIDNASSFLAGETTLSSDAILSFSISNNAIQRIPVVSPTLSPTELATLEYSITPDISSGQGFCSNAAYNNQFDCTNNAGTWSQGLLFATEDQCSDPTFTTQATCVGPNVWIEKGTFYGAPTTAIPETEFTITTTTLLDKTIESKISISVNTPPAGLSIARNVLLHVASATAFEIGDAISSSTGGKGTVTGKFRVNATNAEKSTYHYDFLEVKVLTGSFQEFDDLDNLPNFDSQKTYTLGEGVYYYNTKLSVADSSSFKDKEYNDYAQHENLLQVLGSDRARVSFNDEVNNTLYVTVYDTQTYAVNVEPNSLSTGDTIVASNITGTPSQAVTSIEANNLVINFSPTNYLGLSSNSKGHDITSSGTGIGMLHYFDSGTQMKLSVTEGLFNLGDDLDAISPHSGDATESIDTISNDYTIYFYRGVEGSAEVLLDVSTESTTIELDKALPAGLEVVADTRGVVRIMGTPTSPSAKEKFTLTASNAFGATTYEFFIKVYNQVLLTDATGSTTYILHKTGKGNGRKPCAVTEEQMLYGDLAVTDISCFLDAGEDELHWNGVKLEFKMGENLCQFVDEKPIAHWRFAPGEANTALAVNLFYRHDGYDDCTSDAPVNEYTTDAAGTTSISTIVDPRILLDKTEPANLCIFNYSAQREDSDLPNCDTGQFDIRTISWSAQPFECFPDNGIDNAGDCEDSNGTCTGGGATGTEATRDECEALGGGETWNVDANIHNDSGSLDGYDAGSTDIGACLAEPFQEASPVLCGGETNACLAGARTSWGGLTGEQVLDGATTLIHNMSVGNPKPTTISSDYIDRNYSGSEFGTNVWYSNYHSLCSVDDYKPDVTTLENEIRAGTPPLDDPATHALAVGASSTYEFVCKSGTGTIKSRIRLVVRDFDRDFKVKFGFCDNASFTNEEDCTLSGGTWGQSGIDYFNPDDPAIANGSTGAADPLNYLFNSTSDGFGDDYNRYNNQQNFITGGTCASPTLDFDPTGSVRIHPEEGL